MWDISTIKTINKHGASSIYARVFALGNGKFALGNRGQRALYVVRRLLTGGTGRPRYVGVRGVRPTIGPEALCLDTAGQASTQLRTALKAGL